MIKLVNRWQRRRRLAVAARRAGLAVCPVCQASFPPAQGVPTPYARIACSQEHAQEYNEGMAW